MDHAGDVGLVRQDVARHARGEEQGRQGGYAAAQFQDGGGWGEDGAEGGRRGGEVGCEEGCDFPEDCFWGEKEEEEDSALAS